MSFEKQSVLGNQIILGSVVATEVDGVVTKILVQLKSLVTLTDPIAFISTNNLTPEIMVKAGVAGNVADILTILTKVEESASPPFITYTISYESEE